MEFLERETPEFISPLLWPGLNPVDYSVLQEKLYKARITDLDYLKHRIRIRTKCRPRCITPLLLQLCVSGVAVFQLVPGRVVVISSTAFNSDIVFLR